MPQPRQVQPPPRQSSRGEALAVAGTGVAATAAAATPAAVQLAATATTAAAAAAVAKRIAEALMRFGRKRAASADDFMLGELRRRYPDRPLAESRDIIGSEAELEEAFRRKQLARVQAAMRDALAEPDEAVRAGRINTILEAEKRFVRLRENAMLARSISRQEQRLLRESSPAGAYWKLSPLVKEHTLDCLLMGERFWPWSVLAEFAPPLHAGCPCGLLGLDEAIAAGYMTADHVPDARDARQAYRDIRDQLDGLQEAFGIIVVDELDEDGLDPADWLLEASDQAAPALAPAPVGGWGGIEFAHGPLPDGDEDDSNLVSHAKRELHLAGLDKPDSDYGGMIADSVLDMVRTHSREGHSGFSSAITLSVLNRLLNFENLTPLTDDPAEWVNHGKIKGDSRYPKGMWQSSRNSRAFSADGGKTYTLLDDRTGGGRKRNKTYTSAPKSSKLEEANRGSRAKAATLAVAGALSWDGDEPKGTQRAVPSTLGTSAIVRPRVTRGDGHQRHRLRWEKGWVKGGQFKPKRGVSNRTGVRTRKLRVSRPKPPTENRRGRWQFVGGTYTNIPEASRWERTVDGVKFTSPPGTTNVYREGTLIATPTADLHPDARRRGRERPAITVPDVPIEKADALDALRAELRAKAEMRAKSAVDSANLHKPPVAVGDGPEALSALRNVGFRVNPSSGLHGGRTEFTHPSGARLRVRVDRSDYSVAGVEWMPKSGPQAPRRRTDKPPETWESLVADALALADRIGSQYDADVLVPEVRVDPKLEDHGGSHEWNGDVRIGKEAPIDIEMAAKLRREGKPLDEFTARGLYSTYRTLAHEVLGHGVNPIDASDYSGGGRNLEEALAEENAILDTNDWLMRHKLHDVLDWADANPSNLSVAGTYLHERGALAMLFNHAGVTAPNERIKLLRELGYRTPAGERMNHLGLLIFDEDQRADEPNFERLEDAIAHVNLTLDHAADSTTPRGVMWGRPKTITFSKPDVKDVPDALADAVVKQAGVPYQPDIDRLGGFDPGLVDVASMALTGDRNARWELAQRADVLGPHVKAALEAVVGPVEAADHGIQSITPNQVGRYLSGAAWGGLMHYGADREVAARLLDGEAPEHDPGHKYRLFGTGFYGTTSFASAKGAPRMAGPKGAVVDVAVRLEHPLTLDDAGQRILDDVRARADERFEVGSTDHADYVRSSLLTAGYDGVVRDFGDQTWAVALHPEHQVATIEARKVPGLRPFRPITATQRDVGPDVAAGRAGIAGDLGGSPDPLAPSFGTGARFSAGDGSQRLELTDANLYHPRDSHAAVTLHNALRDLDAYAEDGHTDQDRLSGIADAFPHGGDSLLAREAARQAVERHRDARERRDRTADTAATEMMRALGFDGVDVRHVPEFPAESVLYRRRDRDEMASPIAMDSASGGAVVGGVAGRWVWIRGTYRHIPHGSAYDERADGVRFHSPEGSTDVYRWPGPNERPQWTDAHRGRRVLVDIDGDGTLMAGEIIGFSGNLPQVRYDNGAERIIAGNEFVGLQVARPRWTDHPDVRRPPRGQSTRRRRGQTTTRRPPVDPPPPPPPPPPPAPFVAARLRTGDAVRVGMMIRDVEHGHEGRVTRVGTDGTLHAMVDGREWHLSIGDLETVRPELAPDQRVRVHRVDGTTVEGVVRRAFESYADVEDDAGNPVLPAPHVSQVEVIEQAPRRPEGAPALTNDDMLDLLGSAPADDQDGAELVPGVRYSRSLMVPVTANKLPEILVGPSFFELTDPRARVYALTTAQGFGLWNSIEQDEDALQELSGMWTDGRMSAEVDGRRVHLDRYSLPAAVAAGYAKLNGDWRADAAIYPDSLRWIALQAERRGYPLSEDVLNWARGNEIGGPNGRDAAVEMARQVSELDDKDAIRSALRDAGYQPRATGARGIEAFTAVEDGEVRTVELHSGTDPATVARVLGYTHVRPGTDDPTATLADTSRGQLVEDATRAWREAGWRHAGSSYYGNGYTTLLINSDGTREARLTSRGPWGQRRIDDVYVGPVTAEARWQMLSASLRAGPERVIEDRTFEGASEDILRRLMTSGSGWTLDTDVGGALTFKRVQNIGMAPNVEYLRFVTEDGLITEVGYPNAGDRGLVRDRNSDELGRRVEAERNRIIREYTARQERLEALADRIRVAVNEGREPFAGDENFEDVNDAFRLLRNWTAASNARALTGGGTSITFQNRDTGAKVIIRRHAPDAEGIVRVQARSRVTQGRRSDLGRNRVTGRLPADELEWKADVLGRSDEHRRARRAEQNDIRAVQFYANEQVNQHAQDHAGVHQLDTVGIGARALPDLLEAHRVIAGGGTLTDDQCSRVYASYKVMQHEINHGVRGTGGIDYSDTGGKGIEEALVEELAHVEMVDWMRSHGLEQVVQWARRTESGPSAMAPGTHLSRLRGSYLGHRQNFRRVLERAGMIDDPGLVDLMNRLKYREQGSERPRILGEFIAAREGITPEEGRLAVLEIMQGGHDTGNRWVDRFVPILRAQRQAARAPLDGSDPDTEAIAALRTEFPIGSVWRDSSGSERRVTGHDESNGEVRFEYTGSRFNQNGQVAAAYMRTSMTRVDGAVTSRRVGDYVAVRPLRGRRFRGRVIELGTGDRAGQVKVRKIGRGEEVWTHVDRSTLVDRNGNPLPDTSGGGGGGGTTPRPPRTDVPWASDGTNMLGVGAVYRGTSSGQLGTITAIVDRNNATVRRADGTSYTGTSNQFRAVVITNEGHELKIGDLAIPAATGGERGRVIRAIDYRDPQRPLVQFAGEGEWYDGRTLTFPTSQPVIRVRNRAGDYENVNVGTRVKLRDGSVAEVLGQTLLEWPLGEKAIKVRVNGGGERNVFERDITGIAGERPVAPTGYQSDADEAYRLAMANFQRQAVAKRRARDLMLPLNAQIADQVEEWWRAQGLPVERNRAKVGNRTFTFDTVVADAYGRIFESREADAGMAARLRETVTALAGATGMPLPDWSDEPQRPLAPGEAPRGPIWDEDVLRATWTGQFGRTGMTSEVHTVRATAGRSAEIGGRVLTRNGSAAGTFSRNVGVDPDGNIFVYHAYLSISRRYQGGGFASAFNRHAEAIYRAKGVKYVKVSANIDVGGYAWAATGFDFNVGGSTPELRAAARAKMCRDYLDSALSSSRISRAEYNSVVEKFVAPGHTGPVPEGKIQHAWELANCGGPATRGRNAPQTIGQKILLNRHWSGIKHLVGPERSPFAG